MGWAWTVEDHLPLSVKKVEVPSRKVCLSFFGSRSRALYFRILSFFSSHLKFFLFFRTVVIVLLERRLKHREI